MAKIIDIIQNEYVVIVGELAGTAEEKITEAIKEAGIGPPGTPHPIRALRDYVLEKVTPATDPEDDSIMRLYCQYVAKPKRRGGSDNETLNAIERGCRMADQTGIVTIRGR